MKVAVWDTYVLKKNGEKMHFDIIVPENIIDETIVHEMGKKYLFSKGEVGQLLSAKQCRYCHQEIASFVMEESIQEKGFYILEMEGCE